jgi:pectate lyase
MIKSVIALLLAAAATYVVEPSGPTSHGVPMEPTEQAAASTAEPAPRTATARKAFPGARGFGASTPGGRGGRVILVTNRHDDGPGSLRAALTATEPRFVVFRVSGTITLETGIEVTSPYLTVAGQSARPGGITLRVDPCSDDAALGVYTHDVVIRYLRVRRGANTCAGEGDSADGIVVYKEGSYNVVVDHSSVSWAVDENLSTYDYAHDVTFSWNIVSEGLSKSTHPEGRHSKGVHLSGEGTYNISFHHNLLAHNDDRNPQPTNPGVADIRNNIVYNYGSNAALASNSHGRPLFNFVGNWYIPGPDSEKSEWELDVYEGTDVGWAFYVKGNLGPHRTENSMPERRAVSPAGRSSMVGTPFPAPNTATTSAAKAYRKVLRRAGASLPFRDAVDRRIVRQVKARGGHIIDSPSEVGGWPGLPKAAAPPDSDSDGMPDAFERRHGTGPSIPDAWGDIDGDGWGNVEEYVNRLARP